MTPVPDHQAEASAPGGTGVALLPFRFWLPAAPGPLPERLGSALAAEAEALAGAPAEPLRWAITAADPQRGLLLEGVIVTTAGDGATPSGGP